MRPTNFSEVTNFITQLAYCSLLRHRSRTPRLLVIDVATLRHGSRTPRLLGIEVATWIVIREEAEHATGDSRRSKGATTVHSYGGNFLRENPKRTRVAPRPAMLKPSAPSTTIRAPAPKKLIRDELRERLAKGLCWHYDEPWSREHRYKKGRLLMIEPVEDEDSEPSEESLKPEDEATEEEPQPTDYAVHALAGYSNP
ncbi:hypothetical protein BHE74_00054707 [Ensete ventricosum]|nr:hypothetical protein BHE74_00054707 [Ensete ventricosum]